MTHSKHSLYPFGVLATALAIAFLVGCGASPTQTTTTVYPSLTGNWQFEVQILASPPTIPNVPIIQLFGSLASSGNRLPAL
jgi:hypothetical protein